jgi:hypothetical protein
MATVIKSTTPAHVNRRRVRVTATSTGIVGALLAVIAGSLFDVRPPEAYGICMACHARDLVDWVLNAAAGTHLTVAAASLVYPVLTPIGVLIGALIGAHGNGEFRFQRPDNSIKTFLYGVLVMNCALVAGGCSIRLLLRAAAAEPAGLIGFGALAAGVIAATRWLQWSASQ